MLQTIVASGRLAVLAVACLSFPACSRSGSGNALDQCEIAIAAGRYDQAVPILNAEVRKSPEDADLIQWLGLAYWKMGQIDKAAECFETAQRLLPGDARPSEYLGYVETQRKRWPQAEAALARSLRASPKNTRAWTALALVRMGTNNLSSAQSYLKEAIRIDTNYPPALYNLAWLNYYRKLDAAEAAPLFKRYLAISGDKIRSTRARAILKKIDELTPPSLIRTSVNTTTDKLPANTSATRSSANTTTKSTTKSTTKTPARTTRKTGATR